MRYLLANKSWQIEHEEIEYVKTNEFGGISDKIVVSEAGDFGVEYTDTLDIKSATYTAKRNLPVYGTKFWFSTNMCSPFDNHDILPLGLSNSGCIKYLKPRKKDNLVYCNFNPQTNRELRPGIMQICSNKGFIFCQQYQQDSVYFENLSRSYFSICPPGNGLDSYRIWESLYLGTIPIVLDSYWSQRLRDFFPVVIVKNYDDITTDALEKHLINCSINKSRLDKDYWINRILELTKSEWERTPFGQLIKIKNIKSGRIFKINKAKLLYAKDEI